MIVVFGSFNVDVVMSVERLPKPGETVIDGDYFLVPGGKGANQACAAARAARGSSSKVAMVGTVGEDDWGAFALTELAAAGVDLDAVGRSARRTGCAVICVDAAGENSIAVANGANLDAVAAAVPDGVLAPGNWLVLQMEVPPEQNWALIARAREAGAKILLNVAPAAHVPAEMLGAVDILVFNEIEALMVAQGAGLAIEDPVEIAGHFCSAYGITCIATLGAAGLAAFAAEGAWRVGALPVTSVDTTGAGDTFVGILAAALDAGTALPEALRRATVGAGICCETMGTQSSFPWADQIEARMSDSAVPAITAVEH